MFQVQHTMSNSSLKWQKTPRVGRTCTNETLGKISIQKRILQGDLLSPLLFAMALILLTRAEKRKIWLRICIQWIENIFYLVCIK